MAAIEVFPLDTSTFSGDVLLNDTLIVRVHRTPIVDGAGVTTGYISDVLMSDGSQIRVEGSTTKTDYWIKK